MLVEFCGFEWDSIKNERNINKKNIMNGNIDYDIINKDTKIIKFKSLWEQLKRYENQSISFIKLFNFSSF